MARHECICHFNFTREVSRVLHHSSPVLLPSLVWCSLMNHTIVGSIDTRKLKPIYTIESFLAMQTEREDARSTAVSTQN